MTEGVPTGLLTRRVPMDPNDHGGVAQLQGTPKRRLRGGGGVAHAITVGDLRAMAHRRMPRFVLEYLEGGAEEEASLWRDREVYARWRFVPRQLVDVSGRRADIPLLGRPAELPLAIAPTGLNGIFRRGADLALARAAAAFGVPFIQSTMSNERMEDVAKVPNLRHWWQLYVFGPDEVWQELVRRADACGCEALVLTTNAQIFGNREWSSRTRSTATRPSAATVLETMLHPGWLATTLAAGLPVFSNIADFIPEGHRGFFDSAFWVRAHQPTSLAWDTVDRIRQRWRKPFLLKGLLHPEDVRRAVDAGVDGVVLSTHGGRQLDWAVSGLDMLPAATQIAQDRIALYVSGGLRRGTDLLKAMALGAQGVLAGRAPLYGLCAGGQAGVERCLEILRQETLDAMGLLGVAGWSELGRGQLVRARDLA